MNLFVSDPDLCLASDGDIILWSIDERGMDEIIW